MAGGPEPSSPIEFGRFTVVRHRRQLLADGRAVDLSAPAFDTLLALIDARGSIVDKHALLEHVWPEPRGRGEPPAGADLGAAQGVRRRSRSDQDRGGRGYQFTGELRNQAAVAATARPTNLPASQSELIGREGRSTP
jgi:hypothetical protein